MPKEEEKMQIEYNKPSSGKKFSYYHVKSSEGTITTMLSGDVYSAHAFLALSGDFIKIENRDEIVMLHTGEEKMQIEYNKPLSGRKFSYYHDYCFIRKSYGFKLANQVISTKEKSYVEKNGKIGERFKILDVYTKWFGHFRFMWSKW